MYARFGFLACKNVGKLNLCQQRVFPANSCVPEAISPNLHAANRPPATAVLILVRRCEPACPGVVQAARTGPGIFPKPGRIADRRAP